MVGRQGRESRWAQSSPSMSYSGKAREARGIWLARQMVKRMDAAARGTKGYP